MIIINASLCNGCGICREVCPVEAIQIVNGKAVVNSQCVDCGTCVTACPQQAISAEGQ